MRLKANILYIFSFTVLLFSCKHKEDIPKGILPPDKFQAVVWDLIRADQFVISYEVLKDSSLNKNKASIEWYGKVLSLHHVTESAFKSSLAYYQSKPALMAVMMDSLSKKTETPTFKQSVSAKTAE
jgi:hypothetical protein